MGTLENENVWHCEGGVLGCYSSQIHSGRFVECVKKKSKFVCAFICLQLPLGQMLSMLKSFNQKGKKVQSPTLP
jgi:hypothetical protein